MDNMIESSLKKRERPQEASEVGDGCQQHKKTLHNIFTSLQIANNGNPSLCDGAVNADFDSFGDASFDEGNMDTDTGACCSPNSHADTDDGDSEEEYMQLRRSSECDNLLSLLKNGTRKYGRRVDYLVDELIRKSQKTHSSNKYSDLDYDQILPNSIGPHPLTDRALGMLWPTVVPTMEGAAMMKLPYGTQGVMLNSSVASNTDSCMDEDNFEVKGISSSESAAGLSQIIEDCEHVSICPHEKEGTERSTKFSNDVTHSDWGIEEVGDLT